MTWNTMSSKSFPTVCLATAMLKMETLPTWWFSVEPSSFRWVWWSKFYPPYYWSLRCTVVVVDVSVSEFVVSARWASFIFKHCLNAPTHSGRWRGRFGISIQTKNTMFGVLQPLSSSACFVVSFKKDAIEKYDSLFTNLVFRQWFAVSFLFATLWKYRRMVSVFSFSRFLLHLLRPVENQPVFQRHHVLVLDWSSSSWQSQRMEVTSQLVFCNVVSLREYFKFLPQLQQLNPISEKHCNQDIEVFAEFSGNWRDSSLFVDLLPFWLMCSRNCHSCWCFSNIPISFVMLFFRPSCSFHRRDRSTIWGFLRCSPHLVAILQMFELLVQLDLVNHIAN